MLFYNFKILINFNVNSFTPLTARWGKSNHPMFFCCYFFVMKNFGSTCEISLFNPLEFTLSSRENDIDQVAAARIDDHTGPFYGIFHHFCQNFRRQVLTFLANILLKGFKCLRFVDVNLRLQKNPIKRSLERLNRVI